MLTPLKTETDAARRRNLLIVRHAKSSWNEAGLPDHERPLNRRGERDAPFMGAVLRQRGFRPEAIVSSPARRARMTAERLAEALGYAEADIAIRAAMYEQGLEGAFSVLQSLDDRWHRVILVGHNPDLLRLINLLGGETLTHLPTCGMAALEFELDSWTHVYEGSGRLAYFDYPKRHPELR